MSAADLSTGAVDVRDGKHPNGFEPLLAAEIVAERLGVPKTWVYAEARSGRLPSVTLGRYVRFRWRSIELWLTDLENGSSSPYRRYSPAAPGHRPGGSQRG